jgi:hypothetical protein
VEWRGKGPKVCIPSPGRHIVPQDWRESGVSPGEVMLPLLGATGTDEIHPLLATTFRTITGGHFITAHQLLLRRGQTMVRAFQRKPTLTVEITLDSFNHGAPLNRSGKRDQSDCRRDAAVTSRRFLLHMGTLQPLGGIATFGLIDRELPPSNEQLVMEP